MNTNLKIFISALIIIVVAFFLIKRKSIENFTTKTLSGKECIPWKNAVQFRDYGDSRKCKNPESDINGSWCYTDTFGNYEYCGSFDPGCMNMKILEGCFTPDKDAYQIVIYNSQPFREKYLDLDQIVDSTNQIWCLDKSGRFLRTAKKSKYVNYEWNDMVDDSLKNYDPNSQRFYFISGYGVKKGGFVDTQKNNREEEVNSLMASEVCYLSLRNYFNRNENCLMRCILSEKINIQSDTPDYYIRTSWRSAERNYINLGKKLKVDKNGFIFGIHREKIKEGKGLHWGDMVIGLEDSNGEFKFNLLGNTFPKDLSKLDDPEYSNTEEDVREEDEKDSRRYIVNTKKKLFGNEILKFVHKSSYILNDLLNKKDSQLIDEFMDEISGKTQLTGDDETNVAEFNRYLKYRILLNNDFRFEEEGELFTYTLRKNNQTRINPVFDNEDVMSLLDEFPNIKYINITKEYLKKLGSLGRDLNFRSLNENFNSIVNIENSIQILTELNETSSDHCRNNFCIHNLKYSTRSSNSFNNPRSLKQELDGVINIIKDLELRGSNDTLRTRLQALNTAYDENFSNLKQGFDNSNIKNKYNSVLDKMLEFMDKFKSFTPSEGAGSTDQNTRQDLNNYLNSEFGAQDQILDRGNNSSSYLKRIYYKIVYLMMDYFISRTEFIYDSITKTVENLEKHLNDEVSNIQNGLRSSPCYSAENQYGGTLLNTQDHPSGFYNDKINEELQKQRTLFSKNVISKISNLLNSLERDIPPQGKENIMTNVRESFNRLKDFAEYRGIWSSNEIRGELKTCTYEYIPNSGLPAEYTNRQEYNCFQDFVTRQILDLKSIKEKLDDIYNTAKYPKYNIEMYEVSQSDQVDEYAPRISKQNTYYVFPEVADYLGKAEVMVENLGRKEALLRYNTNFFYMLDELIELERQEQSNFNREQQKILANMFKLFFDKIKSEDDMAETEPPIQSIFDDYESYSDSYINKNLFNISPSGSDDDPHLNRVTRLFPQNLMVETDFNLFSSNPLNQTQRELQRNCGVIYNQMDFINNLRSNKFVLKEIVKNYKSKKMIIDSINLDVLNFDDNLIDFSFANDFLRLCNTAKDNLFDRLLLNYIRDDVKLFESGDVSVSEIYINIYSNLQELEAENRFAFDTDELNENKIQDIMVIRDRYTQIHRRFDSFTSNFNLNQEIVDFLNTKNIRVANQLRDIHTRLEERQEQLDINLGPSPSNENMGDLFYEAEEFKDSFNYLKTSHETLTEYYQNLLENLLRSFPNVNILNYLDYLQDYSRCSELDIIRKLEVAEETLKIMGEISNQVIHEGFDIGVVDFNLTDKYLYIDYLMPIATRSDAEVEYDWTNKSTENVFSSLYLITVKLNKDYIDHIFDSNYSTMNTLRYLDKQVLPEFVVPNDIESEFEQVLTLPNKILTLFEKDEEGNLQKVIRKEFNIGADILIRYRNEFNNVYKDLRENPNENYEALMRTLFFNEIREEISKYRFVEQGRFIMKQDMDTANRLYIYLKEYDTTQTPRQQVLTYNEQVNSSLQNSRTSTTNNVRYFHDFSDKEDHPNLYQSEGLGTTDDKMLYKIIPGSLTASTSGFGMMSYNFTNSLYKGSDEQQKLLNNVYYKKNVFFQIYGKQYNGEDVGPIELVNKTELGYILTPEIKYTHGIVYTEKLGLKRGEYYGLLYWFYLKQKEGKFVNIKEWLKFYKTLRLEGLYNIAADPYKFKLSTDFARQFEEYIKSLESKPDIGRLDQKTMKTLEELKDFVYDKDLQLETTFPQIKLHRLKTKKYSNQVFVELKRFDPESTEEINELDRTILKLLPDVNSATGRDIRKNNPTFLDKYTSHIQDRNNNISFKYNYYRVLRENKFDLLADNDFCENSERKNKYSSLFRFKIIENFDDYKEIVEADKVRDEATNRTKGLYDLNNIYKDDRYYNLIEDKLKNSKDATIVNTCKKILDDKKKNMLMGAGYPFMVLYQVRDYEGYPCQEGNKNSERIFLTFNLKPNFIFNSLDELPNDLIDQKEGPLISEEFLSYTGQGASIRFGFQKARGDTPIKTKDVCSTSVYEAIPGYSDECGVGSENCGSLSVGMTRLDGIPKCALGDTEVKTKSATPVDVSIIGNVATNSCDIYKIKGNKKIKYTLGKMFGYNDAGKYQLQNQYTLKYGDYYFYYQKRGNKILFKDQFITDPEVISNYAFNLTYGEDKYGVYILLNPHLGPRGSNARYLTRVINIYDKHFDEWKLEKKMDKVDDKKKEYIRDNETGDKKIFGDPDLDFYAQKFNLPEDVVLKIASEEGIKSELLEKMKSDLAKSNFLFCNVGGQGESPVCKGDMENKPEMTLDEENEILRKQATQINSLMSRFDNIPNTYFEKFPQNQELLKYMKSTINTIKEASEFVYKRVREVNWVVKTQMESNAEVNRVAQQTTEKISNNNISDQPMGDLIDEQGIMEDALKSMKNMTFSNQNQSNTRQCKTLEGFTNMTPAASDREARFNRNLSGRYYDYVKDEIAKKKNNISELNDKIHNLLQGLNKMSDNMDLSGEKKQMLLSEMIQEKNKLEKMIFDIKNLEQQDRLNRINEKLTKVEEIREEMDEDNFEVKKPVDDMNNISVISREDGEFLNMYKINDKSDPDHLLFINGGCLEYQPEKRDISVKHCMADSVNQQFNIFRVEDKNDMENYNIKNSDQGIEKPFDIVRTKDGKCLHKENGEISIRNCDNTKNQYWDYSSITGPCNM